MQSGSNNNNQSPSNANNNDILADADDDDEMTPTSIIEKKLRHRRQNFTNNNNASLDDSLATANTHFSNNSSNVSNGFHLKQNISQSYSLHDIDEYELQQQQHHHHQHHPYQTRQDISKEDLKRLMGAISFGYGLFQLAVSLLPPSLLKFISFLGFEGNRRIGITCLKHSRQSEDMRAPLAT